MPCAPETLDDSKTQTAFTLEFLKKLIYIIIELTI